MAIFALVWAWVRGHSPTQLFHAACILGIAIFAFLGIVHERNVGYDECQAAHAKADAAAQARADKVSTAANDKLHSDVAALDQQLPSYLQVYSDKTKPADCTPYAYTRKLKP